jgi:general stress protein YciG
MSTKKQGFASMDKEKREEIARKGAETRKRNAKKTSKRKEK